MVVVVIISIAVIVLAIFMIASGLNAIPVNHKNARCDVCNEINEYVRKFAAADGMVCSQCVEAAGFSTYAARNNEFKEHTISTLRVRKQQREGSKTYIRPEHAKMARAANEEAAAIKPMPVRCPKCGSDEHSMTTNGFSLGKAITGRVIAGGIGLMAGFIGSKKPVLMCQRCGHRWKP